MDERHEAAGRKLRFATIADGDFGRTLHVHAAVIARERVHRQAFDGTARLHATNRRAPAVILERAVDVHRHRIAGIRPRVAAVIAGTRLFFELELFYRVALRTVRQARKEARHGEADVLGIVRLAERTPRGVVR